MRFLRRTPLPHGRGPEKFLAMSDEPSTLDADWRRRIRRGPVEAMVRDLDVSVRQILLSLSRGVPGKQLLSDHPGLQGTDLRACLAYAAEVLRTAPPPTEPVAAESQTIAPSAPPVQREAAENETVAPPVLSPDQVPTIAPAAPVLSSAAVHIPGYEILEELGRGGMGVVYKARAERLDRVVALKMILAAEFADTDMLERFQREAKAAAQLPHAGVVQVYEVGEHDGRPYIVQEFVTGGSLASWLDDRPWSAKQAAELVEAMARAVQAAHDHGVIHRDLKPENVLMTEDGRPKIADFGLAKRMDAADGKTRTGAILGTPSYMAPEQAGGRSKEIGPAADVYALGAILYRLLAGQPPFQGGDILEHAGAGAGAGTRAGASAEPEGAARPGNDRAEVPGQGAEGPVRLLQGVSERPPAVSRWRADSGQTAEGMGAMGTVDPAAARRRRLAKHRDRPPAIVSGVREFGDRSEWLGRPD